MREKARAISFVREETATMSASSYGSEQRVSRLTTIVRDVAIRHVREC
jgi:hypothetical protein